MHIRLFTPQPILESIAETSKCIDLIHDFVKKANQSELEVLSDSGQRWHEMAIDDRMSDVIGDIDSLVESGKFTYELAQDLKMLIKEVTKE